MADPIFEHHFLPKFILICLLSLAYDTTTAASDIDAGKKLFSESCVSCHGSNAQGNMALGGPALAGQHRSYIARQLANFSSGVRGSDQADTYGQQMAAMSAMVKTAEAQANISAYLSSLEKPKASVTDQKTGGGNNSGFKVYQASCGACHGADASGNERLNAPSLVGLGSDYLIRQYANFLAGKRGSHQSDKLGRQMRMIAATVTDQGKIDAVVAYIVSLQD